MMSDKKYWHELPQSEVDELIEKGVTNQYVIDNYLQPEWCQYDEALCGLMGCWLLVDNRPGGARTKVSLEYCKNCDCFKKPK